MEIRDYLRIARRHWLVIVSATAIAVILSALLTSQMTPQYASKARVFISTTPDNSTEAYQGGLFSAQRVSSYADMMNGLELARRVVDDLGLDMTPEQLSNKIQAAAVPDTVLLDVTVTDPSASEAQRINDGVVRQLGEMVKDIETPPGKKTPLLKATVIDPPRLPSSPVSPKPVRNLGLALFLGLLLGFGIAVLRELLDTSVKAVEDVPGLEDVPMIGGLAFDSDVHKHPLLTTLPSHAPRVEAYRVLRTNLQFLDVDSSSKAFVVTSSVPSEGKSTTSTNLALALAQGGKNVLLVEGDLRRPQVSTLLGLEGSVGLTTVLLGDMSLQDALQLHAESGLHVLASGSIPPNPAELLQSQRMREVLDEMRELYDVILIDAPPLLPVTDAALLTDLTDGALVVVHHGKTTKDQLAGAVHRLASVDAVPLGIIFNMMQTKRGGAYGTYGYGYGYGYSPDEAATSGQSRKDQRDEAKAARRAAAQAKAENKAAVRAADKTEKRERDQRAAEIKARAAEDARAKAAEHLPLAVVSEDEASSEPSTWAPTAPYDSETEEDSDSGLSIFGDDESDSTDTPPINGSEAPAAAATSLYDGLRAEMGVEPEPVFVSTAYADDPEPYDQATESASTDEGSDEAPTDEFARVPSGDTASVTDSDDDAVSEETRSSTRPTRISARQRAKDASERTRTRSKQRRR